MFRTIVITFCCLSLLGCVTTAEHQDRLVLASRLQENVDLKTLPNEFVKCAQTVYLLEAQVILEGSFPRVVEGETLTTLEFTYKGSGFAPDAFGHIMTNAHVISPQNLTNQAMTFFVPSFGGIWSGYFVEDLKKVSIQYLVCAPDGIMYTSRYETEIDFSGWPENHAEAVKNFKLVNFGETGKVIVDQSKVDDVADLAVISIPPRLDRSYLEFGSLESLEQGAELYKISMRDSYVIGQEYFPNLEVSWGRLRNKCTQKTLVGSSTSGETLVAEVRMLVIPGDSGSPIVNKNGEVVMVVQGTNLANALGFGVPGDYAKQFYEYVTGKTSVKPTQICHREEEEPTLEPL